MKRRPAFRASRLEWATVICACLVLLLATMLLCDVAKDRRATDEGEWPALIDRLMAVPLRLTDVSDLRLYAVPCGLAFLLGMLALAAHMPGPAPQTTSSPGNRSSRRTLWWLELPAGAALAAGAASATVNHTWELSSGWLFGLVTGCAWAVVLSRCLSPWSIDRVLLGGSLIAIIAVTLSLGHRYFLGERFFQLPVGPVTITAGLGAFWAAIATVRILAILAAGPEGRKGALKAAAWPAFVAVGALLLLNASNRRAAWLGLFGAWAITAGATVWIQWPRRMVRAAVILAALALVSCAALYVRQQSLSPERIVAVPLRVRYTYWMKTSEMIPQAPLLGHGPDMFACVMTTTLAPRRAENPHILHGGVDYDAHNEWLQAIFELGIPGGLAYLAIPLLVVLQAVRAWARESRVARKAALLSCAAGIMVIIIAEASSINLRYSTMGAWYWTLIGVTAALVRRGGEDVPSEHRSGQTRSWVRALSGIAAVAILAVVIVDVRRGIAHGAGRAALDREDEQAVAHLLNAKGRMGTNRWLSVNTYLASAYTNILRKSRQTASSRPAEATTRPADISPKEAGRDAIAIWTLLNDRAAGYLDTGFRLAEAQMLSGDTAAACDTLTTFFRDVNPYDKQANLLWLAICNPTPRQIVDMVRHSLRADQWDSLLLRHLTLAMADPEVSADWPRQVEQARQDLSTRAETTWIDPLAPETLRIEAFRLATTGHLAEAVEAQWMAAEAYARLADGESVLRRRFAAEADAWYLASRFLFDLDPGRYEEAYRAILRAEESAVRDHLFEKVKKPDPNGEFVGQQVVPLVTPAQLRPLWQFSALMHLMHKSEPTQITLRITWSLPERERNEERVFTELGSLAGQAVRACERLPVERRPPSFSRLVELHRQYAPK